MNVNVNNDIPKNTKLNVVNDYNYREGKKSLVTEQNYENFNNVNFIEYNKEEYEKDNNHQTIKEKEKSSLSETIKFSECSSKVEQEGELGMDEVKDIIIYYNMNKESNKMYLFKIKEEAIFNQKKREKYLKTFFS